MLLGYVNFSVYGDNYCRLYNRIIDEKLPCRNVIERNGVLSLTVSVEYSKRLKDLCNELQLEYEIKKKKGIFTLLTRSRKHIGILIGLLSIIIAGFVLSNIVLKTNILSDDVTIRKDIIAVLKENNAYTGSFIPKINCVNIERELKQKVPGISWAGISISDSTLTIDIVESIKAPERNNDRLPSNIVAKRDAVIDKIDVLNGQLMTTIGSGVVKGDTLVSGTVINEKLRYKDGKEVIETNTRYVRSLAKIYGTFEENVTVYQPYEEVTKEISDNKTITKRYLKVFDAEIPLFFSLPKGEYSSKANSKNFSMFGYDFPLGIKKVELNEIKFNKEKFTKIQAKTKAYDKLYKYEQNFYKDYEIKDKSVEEKTSNDGVTLIVKYKLYGEIGEENEFFIKK